MGGLVWPRLTLCAVKDNAVHTLFLLALGLVDPIRSRSSFECCHTLLSTFRHLSLLSTHRRVHKSRKNSDDVLISLESHRAFYITHRPMLVLDIAVLLLEKVDIGTFCDSGR